MVISTNMENNFNTISIKIPMTFIIEIKSKNSKKIPKDLDSPEQF
jgi:hypothetical protein